MGHTWREIDPAGAEAQDKRWNRVRSLRQKLKDVPLSSFTVGELEAVMRLMGLYYNSAGKGEPYEEHLKFLEEKVRKMSL